jgi:predicted anti-sigma-YlaC factor YlaD
MMKLRFGVSLRQSPTGGVVVRRWARIIGLLVGAFYLVFGVWAFLAPESFAESVASYPPYNSHYLKDLGAFQVGLGVGMVAAVAWADGISAAFLGVAAASVLHAASHIQDRALGGRASDPYTVGLIALLVLTGLAFSRRRNGRRRMDPDRG